MTSAYAQIATKIKRAGYAIITDGYRVHTYIIHALAGSAKVGVAAINK